MFYGNSNLDDLPVRNRMFLQHIGFFAILVLILLFRLFYIQIVQGDFHTRLSMDNMMRLKILKAPRGRIFDRDGRILVRNRISYAIVIYPFKIKDKDLLFDNLEKLATLDGEKVFTRKELEKKYNRARRRRFDPTVLKEDVGIELASVIEEHTLDLQGVSIETEIRREYPYGTLAAHLLGYISEIPENQIDSLKEEGYTYDDLIGKAGLEKQYESLFRGEYGQEYVEVNAFGKKLGTLESMPRKDPVRGNDLFLTIDLDIQLSAEQAYPDSLTGAVVVLDPRNGEVLAMLSSPRPDPNLFTLAPEKRSKLWAKVALDPRMPLHNRAVTGTYPPASTYKMVTSITGLELSLVRPEEPLCVCKGGMLFGRRFFRCWKPSGHGVMDMPGAIMHSCDVYFYKLGLLTGAENMNRYARMLGFDHLTGIDLPNEKKGELLDKELYNRKFKSRGWRWSKGMVLNLSIGQGQLVTPVQLAAYIGGLGNGKHIYRPHLLKKVHYPGQKKNEIIQPVVQHNIALREETLQTIRDALYITVNERGGTGGRARVKGFRVGGKTGSAENPQGDITHALFVACAPVDSPVIAVAVVAENAGHGGSVAAPIAEKILRTYFEKFPVHEEPLPVKE